MATYTKIIATIGPASIAESTLRSMIRNGVNCVRINTAHGDFEQYRCILDRVDEIGGVATMLDIKGPELRVHMDDAISIDEAQELTVSFKDSHQPHISYDIYDEVKVGDKVFFDDGYIETTIVRKTDDRELVLRAEHDACLKPNKTMNVRGRTLNLPSLSDKDKECIGFARENRVDYIAQSFVRNKDDILATKKRLGDDPTKIIAKIENEEGVTNLDDIIDVSDGVMIARGDLGVELPQERIPAVQKQIIRQTSHCSQVSIVATQMLESMTESVKPTRAEVSDVANAVLDGTDAVMLSGETAIGAHPVEAAKTMRGVTEAIEADIPARVDIDSNETLSEEMSRAAYTVANRSSVDKIIVIGEGTKQTRLLSRYRLHKPLISVTNEPRVARQLRLVWGVEPVLVDELPTEYIIPTIAKHVLDHGLIQRDETVVFYAGVGTEDHEEGNLVEAHQIDRFLSYHDLL